MAIVITSPADNTAIGTSAQRRSFTVTATGLTGTRDGGFQRVCMFMHNDAAPNITNITQAIGAINRVIINGETDQQYHAFGVNLAAVNETFYLVIVDEALADFEASLPRNLANEAKGTKFQSVRLRRVAPAPQTQTIVVTAPSSNPSATASSSYTVTWTATAQDAAIIRVFDAAIGGNQVGTDVNISDGTKSQAITLPATAGTYYIQVVVTAAGYRAATSALAAITVTATTPTLRNQTVTITSPAASSTVGQSIDVEWGATHQDSAVICVFDTAAGTSPIGTESITDGTMSGTVTVGSHTGDAWIEVIVTSTRFLESKNSPRLKVTVDANPPPPQQTQEVLITAPAADRRVDSPFAIAWSVTDQTTVQVILQERDGSEITRLSHTQGGAVTRRQTTMATTHTGEAYILIQSTHNSVTSSSARRRVYVGQDPPGTITPPPVTPIGPGDADAPAGSLRNASGIAANVTISGGGAFAIGESAIGSGRIGVGGDQSVIANVISLSTDRGRSTTDQILAPGRATVVLRNDNGEFEPLKSNATFGGIKESSVVKITVENIFLFTGKVIDWSYDYDVSGASATVTLNLADAAAEYANLEAAEQLARPDEAAAARLRAFTAAVGYKGFVDYPSGSELLSEDIYAPASLGQLIEQICTMNNIVLIGRRQGGVKFSQDSGTAVSLRLAAHEGGNVTRFRRDRQRTDFYSAVQATRPGNVVEPVVVERSSSFSRVRDLGELPAVTEAQLRRALDRWITINGSGALRVSDMELALENLSTGQRQQLAAIEPGDRANAVINVPGLTRDQQLEVVVKGVRFDWSLGSTFRCHLRMQAASEPYVAPDNLVATGGIVTTPGDGYRYHTFLGSTSAAGSTLAISGVRDLDDVPNSYLMWSGMTEGSHYDEFTFTVESNENRESFELFIVGGGWAGSTSGGGNAVDLHTGGVGVASGINVNTTGSVSGWLVSNEVLNRGAQAASTTTRRNAEGPFTWVDGKDYAEGGAASAYHNTRVGSTSRGNSATGAQGEDGVGNGARSGISNPFSQAVSAIGGNAWYRTATVSDATLRQGDHSVRVGRGGNGGSSVNDNFNGGGGVVIIRYPYSV